MVYALVLNDYEWNRGMLECYWTCMDGIIGRYDIGTFFRMTVRFQYDLT